jgi:hypothetical protein
MPYIRSAISRRELNELSRSSQKSIPLARQPSGNGAPTAGHCAHQWCSGERAVPAKRAIEIEALTRGAVDRAELCPSFPWAQIQPSSSQALSVA